MIAVAPGSICTVHLQGTQQFPFYLLSSPCTGSHSTRLNVPIGTAMVALAALRRDAKLWVLFCASLDGRTAVGWSDRLHDVRL